MARPVISMFAAIGKNREIGKKGKLIWNFPEDMAYFINNTKGKVIIMGRKTYVDCIGAALEDRINIVISNAASEKEPNVYLVKTMKEAIEVGKAFCTLNNVSEICIIGGERTYKHGMRYADALYVTHIEAEDSEADAFFPAIDPDLWNPIFSTPCVDPETQIPFQITGYASVL